VRSSACILPPRLPQSTLSQSRILNPALRGDPVAGGGAAGGGNGHCDRPSQRSTARPKRASRGREGRSESWVRSLRPAPRAVPPPVSVSASAKASASALASGGVNSVVGGGASSVQARARPGAGVRHHGSRSAGLQSLGDPPAPAASTARPSRSRSAGGGGSSSSPLAPRQEGRGVPFASYTNKKPPVVWK
jgi:hypothetical protein